MKNNLPTRDQIFFNTAYLYFLLQKNLSRKMMCSESKFWEDLGLLIIKNHFHLQFMENIGSKGLIWICHYYKMWVQFTSHCSLDQ
jgi:hypothetical protein